MKVELKITKNETSTKNVKQDSDAISKVDNPNIDTNVPKLEIIIVKAELKVYKNEISITN